MNPFARSFCLLVAASLPAAFGFLVTALEMLQALNEIATRLVSNPDEIAAMKAAAFAPARLGIEVSVPLWLAWGIYQLVVSGRRKD